MCIRDSLEVVETAQLGAESRTVKDVVAQDEACLLYTSVLQRLGGRGHLPVALPDLAGLGEEVHGAGLGLSLIHI